MKISTKVVKMVGWVLTVCAVVATVAAYFWLYSISIQDVDQYLLMRQKCLYIGLTFFVSVSVCGLLMLSITRFIPNWLLGLMCMPLFIAAIGAVFLPETINVSPTSFVTRGVRRVSLEVSHRYLKNDLTLHTYGNRTHLQHVCADHQFADYDYRLCADATIAAPDTPVRWDIQANTIGEEPSEQMLTDKLKQCLNTSEKAYITINTGQESTIQQLTTEYVKDCFVNALASTKITLKDVWTYLLSR
jgi:hypothetical protein